MCIRDSRIASSGIVKGAAKDCINWCIEHYGNVRADTHPNNKAMQHLSLIHI